MTHMVHLRWKRSYLVRETQVYEVEVPADLVKQYVANLVDVGDIDQYVTDNADPQDEYTDHIENRDLTVEHEILGIIMEEEK